MALLTSPGPIVRDSIGSLTQLIIPLTTLNTSDTYNLGAGLPVVVVDVTGSSVTANTSNGADGTYNSTTGLITIVGTTQGPVTMIVQLRT